MVAILQRRKLRDFDWLVAALAITIVGFGTWEIHNAQPTERFWQKQLAAMGIALGAMLVIAFTDYRRVIDLAPVFYVLGLMLLVLVLVPIPGISLKINGHRSWLRIPGLGQFQPSEFVKVTTAMMLANYFGKHRSGPLNLKAMVVGGLILGLPIALILLEHDAGSVLTDIPI